MWTGIAMCAISCALGQIDVDHTIRTIEYHGIRPMDPGGRDGLRNPERGLRIETLIAEPYGAPVWGPAAHFKESLTTGYSDQWWTLCADRYEPYGLTLAQTYCYLDAFMDRPISDEKLAFLQQSLDELRRHGLKTVLRFAYEKEMGQKEGPDLDTILGHLDQLAPVIQRNADVIFVMQAGFVGAWGEWHSAARGLEKDHATLAAVVKRVLEVLPEDRMTQVRVPKYKRWVLEQPVFGGFTELDAASAHNGAPAARIGFNNDGFLAGETCGGTWTEPPLFSNPGNPEFDYMTRESPYVAVDGELFWADQGGKIDGLRAAVRMRLHHYSSFSLDHSYSGREGKRFSIDDWMATPLTAAQVSEAQLPLSDGYFQDAVGGEMARTPFEYIRDHLGYRIELRWAAFPGGKCPGIPFGVRVTLINRGFAAFPNPRPVYFILIRDGQCVAEWPVPEADPRTWQPFAPGDETYAPLEHTIAAECEIPQGTEPGEYLLALWMPDGREPLRNDPRYAVRTANRDTPWWTDAHGTYGANILGTIWVKPMIMDSHVEFIKHP